MAGTMEGLGVPLFGGYTSYQSDGTTAFLTVSAEGEHDFTFTNEGADNAISVTIADSSTVTSGYFQAFYASMTITGSKTASSQMNVYAADIAIGGTIEGEHSGMYLYFMESGTAAFSSNASTLAGVTVNFPSFGDQMAYRGGFHVYSSEADAYNAAVLDCGLWMSCSGTTGTFGSVIGIVGTTLPQYLLRVANAPGEARMFTSDVTFSETKTAGLKCLINGVEYFVALFATCTS